MSRSAQTRARCSPHTRSPGPAHPSPSARAERSPAPHALASPASRPDPQVRSFPFLSPRSSPRTLFRPAGSSRCPVDRPNPVAPPAIHPSTPQPSRRSSQSPGSRDPLPAIRFPRAEPRRDHRGSPAIVLRRRSRPPSISWPRDPSERTTSPRPPPRTPAPLLCSAPPWTSRYAASPFPQGSAAASHVYQERLRPLFLVLCALYEREFLRDPTSVSFWSTVRFQHAGVSRTSLTPFAPP